MNGEKIRPDVNPAGLGWTITTGEEDVPKVGQVTLILAQAPSATIRLRGLDHVGTTEDGKRVYAFLKRSVALASVDQYAVDDAEGL